MTPTSSRLSEPPADAGGAAARSEASLPDGVRLSPSARRASRSGEPRSLGRFAHLAYGVLGAVLVLGLWQAAAASGRFGSGLPSVLETLSALAGLLGTAAFWSELGATIGIAAIGLAVSSVIGVVFGVLAGRFPLVRSATLAVTEFLKPIPPIVVLPLAVMIWGPTQQMAIFLVIVGCALAIAIQTIAGVEDVDPVALSTARSYGIGTAESLWRIVLPSSLPFIGTAMRIAAPASLVVTVVAGLLGGSPGLGRSIYLAQSAGEVANMYALVVVLGVLGVAAQGISSAAERRLLHWHPSFRKTGS
jgi:ABC-type nitrate/sulfonate/bicarbonate transport system permease component